MSKTYQASFYQNIFQQFDLLVVYAKNGVLTFASKIIINVFFNNKQNLINATVQKDAVESFKSIKKRIVLKVKTNINR